MKIFQSFLFVIVILFIQSCSTAPMAVKNDSNINNYIMPKSCINKSYVYHCTQNGKHISNLHSKYSISGEIINYYTQKELLDKQIVEQNEQLKILNDHFYHINNIETVISNGSEDYSIEYLKETENEYHKKLIDKDRIIENIYGFYKSVRIEPYSYNDRIINCLIIEIDETHHIKTGNRQPVSNQYYLKYIYGYQIGLIKTIINNDKNLSREIVLEKIED